MPRPDPSIDPRKIPIRATKPLMARKLVGESVRPMPDGEDPHSDRRRCSMRGLTLSAQLGEPFADRSEHAHSHPFLRRSRRKLHPSVGGCAPNRDEALSRGQHDDLADEERGAGEAEDGEDEKDGHGCVTTP